LLIAVYVLITSLQESVIVYKVFLFLFLFLPRDNLENEIKDREGF